MTPLAIRVSRAPKRRQPPARRGRARDVAALLPPRRRETSRSAMSQTARICRRSSAGRCAGSSPATSARAGSGAPPIRRRGSPSARSRTRSSGPPAASRASGCVAFVRERSQQDGLRRGEQIDVVRAVARQLDPSVLTLGFARRLATYKRLHLLTLDPDRARRVLGGERPVQLLVAGKAHPNDDPGKDTLQRLIRLQGGGHEPRRAGRVRRRLRPRHRPAARLGLRRVGQPPPPPDGGERDERDEGHVQRRAPAERARRLVGRGLRRLRTGGRSPATRAPTTTQPTPTTPASSTTCSSTRSSRSSTTGTKTACRTAGASGSSRRSSPARPSSRRRGWSTTTPRGCTRQARRRSTSARAPTATVARAGKPASPASGSAVDSSSCQRRPNGAAAGGRRRPRSGR